MEIVPFNNSHFAGFLNSAMLEGWITDQRELEFLLKTYPQGCLVFILDDQPAGFITATRYVKSAWIGNLLVLPEYRKRGLGRALIEKVLHYLDLSACETVWLTASAEGAPLYKSLGFMQIDTVQRWAGSTSLCLKTDKPACVKTLTDIDAMGWGDDRLAIYELIEKTSLLLTNKDGFLACSSSGNFKHIGPWGAVSGEAAADILNVATGHDSVAMDTIIDVPATNMVAGELLRFKGFSVSGTTLLMYRGNAPEYRAEYVYALASMGSYG